MKNWAIIAIFLAAMVSSVRVRNSHVRVSACKSGELSAWHRKQSVASRFRARRRALIREPMPDLKKLAEDLTEYQRGLIEGHNQQLKEHFTAQQQAGGWQRVFLKQLALQRLDHPNATLQLNAAQQVHYKFCFL